MWTIPVGLPAALAEIDIQHLKIEFEVEEHAYILKNQDNLLATLKKTQSLSVLKNQALALEKILPNDQKLSYEEFEVLHQRLEKLYHSCQILREFAQEYKIDELPAKISLNLHPQGKLENLFSQLHSLYQCLFESELLPVVANGIRVLQHSNQQIQIGFSFRSKAALLVFAKMVFSAKKVLHKRKQLSEQMGITRNMNLNVNNKKEILAAQAQEMVDYLDVAAQSICQELHLKHGPTETLSRIKESIRHLSWLINGNMNITVSDDAPEETQKLFAFNPNQD